MSLDWKTCLNVTALQTGLDFGIKRVLERKCCRCGKSISECSGFVVAGDFLKLLQSHSITIPMIVPRELCGKCGVLYLNLEDFSSTKMDSVLSRSSKEDLITKSLEIHHVSTKRVCNSGY